MRKLDDQKDDIVPTTIIFREPDLYRTDIRLVHELNFLLQQINLMLLQIDVSNFNLILIYLPSIYLHKSNIHDFLVLPSTFKPICLKNYVQSTFFCH